MNLEHFARHVQLTQTPFPISYQVRDNANQEAGRSLSRIGSRMASRTHSAPMSRITSRRGSRSGMAEIGDSFTGFMRKVGLSYPSSPGNDPNQEGAQQAAGGDAAAPDVGTLKQAASLKRQKTSEYARAASQTTLQTQDPPPVKASSQSAVIPRMSHLPSIKTSNTKSRMGLLPQNSVKQDASLVSGPKSTSTRVLYAG